MAHIVLFVIFALCLMLVAAINRIFGGTQIF